MFTIITTMNSLDGKPLQPVPFTIFPSGATPLFVSDAPPSTLRYRDCLQDAPIRQIPSIPGRVTGTAQAYLSAGVFYQAAVLYHHNVARLNQGAATSAFNVTAAITETWYRNELVSYTVVLWKGTTKVGYASVDCSGKMKVNGAASDLSKFTVCNYATAGGVNGLFALDIGRPVSTTNLGKWID
ncbi:hypothetical protein E8E11_006999 [Didymella keratinophila]|nr:hypothetical protein E8E11_006999 [Didymella keratinophila]